MPDLPAGTVTFLFTTVEGSVRLLEQHPQAYRAALVRYDALLRGAVESHGGAVFESVGDAVYAAFARSPDAVAAALAAQVALQSERWGEVGEIKARMALHTGDVELQGQHYFGAPLYRSARIMATAHGEQVLLSSVTAGLVREALPERATLRGLGTHRLKDLAAPEEIFQALHPDLRADFPPLKSLSTLHNNLPVQLTSFVGRERELAEVQRLLAAARLVTLVGIGGTGKTRLSLQVAAEALEDFPDGVWQVELAALGDAALVPQAVASALGVREEPGRPLLDTLLDFLRPKRLLLLLDNCEHLLAACAALAESLLRACPEVRILATSQAPLEVPEERVWAVPSLGVPDPQRLPRDGSALVAALATYEAVRLFVDRAVATLPSFSLTERNARAVAEVCRQLDGIPLAIELAAARVNVITVEQIAARLQDRFRLLTRGNRAALPRQQTLRAVVAWSYDLLQQAEQALFNRLSVFAGGWTLPAAVAVCADPEADEEHTTNDQRNSAAAICAGEVGDLLSHLKGRSLVVAEAGADAAGGAEEMGRFRMLETLRQYGWERLVERGEAGATQHRHAVYYLEVAEAAEPQVTGPQQAVFSQRLDTEHDNLRAALRWAAESRAAETGWRLGGALYRFWILRGYFSEGRERLAALLALPAPADSESARAARAKALHGAGILAVQQGDYNAARLLYQESLAIRRSLGNKRGVADLLNNLGVLARYQGDYDAARPLYEESLALYRELGEKRPIAFALNNLASVIRYQGDHEAARLLYQESLALLQEVGDKWAAANLLNNLGEVALEQRRYSDARSRLEEGLTALRELGERRALAFLLENFGGLAAAAQAEPERAFRLVGAAAALREAIGAPLPPTEKARLDRWLEPARRTLSQEAQERALAEGRAMPLDAAMDYALEGAPTPAAA
jgi:predicted ATPase/class 3 adenylate cyclase